MLAHALTAPQVTYWVDYSVADNTFKVHVNATASSDSDGHIIKYEWIPSSGEPTLSTTAETTLSFPRVGIYNITLVVTDDRGAKASIDQTLVVKQTQPVVLVNQPPIASFVLSPEQGVAPLKVKLDARASSDPEGSIKSYEWLSSNGLTTTGRESTLTFDTVGRYGVTLKVTDSQNSSHFQQKTVLVLPTGSGDSTAVNQPPIATFTATPTQGNAPLTVVLDASNARDSDGTITAYDWLSSNGLTATGKQTRLTFDNAGRYTLSLVVTDDKNSMASRSIPIEVGGGGDNTASNQAPKASFALLPDSGLAPLRVGFDASPSKDPDGRIEHYLWYASDGQTLIDKKSGGLTFNHPGNYNLTLTVTDNQGASHSVNKYISVTNPVTTPPAPTTALKKRPQADFISSVTTGILPLTVFFDAHTAKDEDGQITQYSWTASDGQTATGVQATFTFSQVGNYELICTVMDNNGLSHSKRQIIEVKDNNAAPVAKFTLDKTQGRPPLTINVEASASSDVDGSIKTYGWTVSDGQTAHDKTTKFTFTQIGTFGINLQVTDDKGKTNDIAQTVTVLPNQVPLARFKIKSDSQTAPAIVTLDASESVDHDGSIKNFAWLSSDGQTASGVYPTLTLASAGAYSITLQTTDNEGATSNASQTIQLTQAKPNQKPSPEFETTAEQAVVKVGDNSAQNPANTLINGITLTLTGLLDAYQAGDFLILNLIENLQQVSRTEVVDLWVAIQLPNNQWVFLSNQTLPFVAVPQAFKTHISPEQTSQRLLTLEIPSGFSGTYQLYAVYVASGKNPMQDSFLIYRSNILVQDIVLH